MQQQNFTNNQISMKQRFRLKRLLAIGFVLALPVLANAQAGNANRSAQQAPYPKLTNSGNKAADLKQFEAAVEQWKKAEQERNANSKQRVGSSNAGNKSNASASRTNQKLAQAGHREIKRVDIPGFPSFIATGNAEADEKAYQAAKARWMAENPEVYEKYLRDNRIENRKLHRPQTTKP
jgi:hypothetical protein